MALTTDHRDDDFGGRITDGLQQFLGGQVTPHQFTVLGQIDPSLFDHRTTLPGVKTIPGGVGAGVAWLRTAGIR
jgi:hypothetical protein